MDFTNGFECSDVHTFEKQQNLSMNTFDVKCYQEENKFSRRKRKLIPIENGEINSDRLVDL